jgi:hypothetical protein
MSKKIKKIQELKIAESFLQVDLIKGFKYIDKAGEIVNAFHQGNTAPMFEMNLQGLVIENPDSNTKTIKISSSVFWAHFLSPGSFELAHDHFKEKLDIIFTALEVKKIKRIGWRNYLIKDFCSNSERDDVVKKFSPSEFAIFQGGLYTCKINDTEMAIQVKKIQKDDSTPALLFDIDCFQKDEKGIETKDVNAELEKMKKNLRSNDLLKVLNEFIA